ncbi:MAG: neutral/alkaline non-lysosomal ceramidase N-terminal domain-containing protein, partial [Lentisphaeria bacterium]|nr:neutral/alkaline non-lysosomal ceramidase N-terminal domain-containing protein [Lentisphaeria bacterium]
MKKSAAGIFLGLAALFLFTSCVSTELNSSKSAAKRLKIGWGKRSIAMEGPVPITGQFYLRVSHGSFTPVEASALVLEDSGDAVIFVSCDVVSVQKDVYNLVREFLRKEIPGFPVEKLIINATHTHAGPGTGNVSLSYPNKVKIIPSEKVQRFVARQIADAVKEAWNNRAEGSIAYGYGFATTGHSRRTIYLKDMGKTFKATSGTTVNGVGKMY